MGMNNTTCTTTAEVILFLIYAGYKLKKISWQTVNAGKMLLK
jgi:hypothetical protein